MEEIIDWFVHLEGMAEKVYGKAAAIFGDDREFCEFLKQLAEEEALHSRIIGRVAECMNVHPSLISLSNSTKQGVESPFAECGRRIEEGKITKEELLEYIVSYEFSEWNDVFLNLVDNFKECAREFIPLAARMQQHKRNIERFAESHPGFQRLLEKTRDSRPLWRESLLVVDDSSAIVRLLLSVLAKEGIVDGASDGKKALEKVKEKYYSVIITDVGMPIMNGIEFYRKASEIYPNIRERILFYTSMDDENSISFFKKNNLRYLIKPADIHEIRKTVCKILNR